MKNERRCYKQIWYCKPFGVSFFTNNTCIDEIENMNPFLNIPYMKLIRLYLNFHIQKLQQHLQN